MFCRGNFLAHDVATLDPAQLTAADAEKIGHGVTAIRLGNFKPDQAAAQVLARYPVLQAPAQQCVWFEPMLAAILLRLMEVSLGTKLRLSLSAVLSFLDVGSDLATMLLYFLAEQYLTGSLILMLVCISTAVQALVVFIQNRHRSAAEMAKEMLILLSLAVPQAHGRPPPADEKLSRRSVDGSAFDTAMERNLCKGIETCFESVPSSIVAMVALLRKQL